MDDRAGSAEARAREEMKRCGVGTQELPRSPWSFRGSLEQGIHCATPHHPTGGPRKRRRAHVLSHCAVARPQGIQGSEITRVPLGTCGTSFDKVK